MNKMLKLYDWTCRLVCIPFGLVLLPMVLIGRYCIDGKFHASDVRLIITDLPGCMGFW